MLWQLLKFVIKCEVLGLDEIFQGASFGHVFSKACQYVTIDEKVCRNFMFVSIKSTQSNLQKCIIWKGTQQWNKICSDFNLPPRKLNTPMKTRWLFSLLQKNSKLLSFLFLIDLL
jgi:hypothetical protein